MAKTTHVTVGALLCLAPVLAAWAGQEGRPGGPPQLPEFMTASPLLRAIDADHDQAISAAELAAAPAALRTLDTNGDGTLTRAEAGLQMPGRGGPGGPRREGAGPAPEQPAPGPSAEDLLSMLLSFDKNADGVLQKAEVPERQAGLFARGDANKDGVLDGAELRKLSADQAAAPVAPPSGPRGGFGRFDLASVALDADQDGEISSQEIANAATALKALDKNDDGQITADEVRPSMDGRGGPR
jgi:Ca2+-binding EF-hand superfamily protein